MSNPTAPPPYEDHNPLYPGPLAPGGYGSSPSVLPGGYPAYPAYPQPGYGHPAGYPQPTPPVHPMPMNYGESWTEAGGWREEVELGTEEALCSLPPTIPFDTFSSSCPTFPLTSCSSLQPLASLCIQ